MAYLSLYRKYRPQTFAQVMGQEHVVQTLQNALRYGHVANGYLFCGTRGVAKTTMARILAKCLNCIGPDGAFTTPQAEPCNQCDPCRTIQLGQNVDVVEMDAASNRSVSDIAKLRESVQFGPMETRYKVYIVDEAHQLTSDAKDAFLKTLEEPPPNVVFILATTEAHSIPITIASRCQQFDFRRGSVQQIVEQCGRVLEAEGVSMPADAIALVARAAEGSYRDALSLLDQVLAYKREGITASDVAGALGTVESETIDGVLRSIADSDQAALFGQADAIYLQGKDVRQFLRALGSRVRDLLFVRSGAPAAGLMESGADAAALKELSQSFEPAALVRMLETSTEAERQTRQSDQHRLLLEMTLLKLASPAAAFAAESTQRAAAAAAPTPAPAQRNGRSAPAPVRAERAPEPVAEPPYSAPVPVEPADGEIPPPQASAAPVAPTPGDSEAALLRLQASWEEVIHHMQVRSPGGAAVVKDANPVEIKGTIISLEFSNKANMAMLDNPKRREAIERVVNKVLRVPDATYKIRAVSATETPVRSVASSKASSEPAYDEGDEATPVLDEVIAVFGGRIVEEE